MSLAHDLTNAFNELTGDLNDCSRNRGAAPFFLWKGKTVRMIPSTYQRATTLELGGFGVDVGFSILTLREYFFAVDDLLDVVDNQVMTLDETNKPVPIAGKRLTYQDKVYTIVSARIDATQTIIRLDLKDPSK